MKKVSVICLTYKRPTLLEEAIYSVINQTYHNIEMVIVNDCIDQKLYCDNSMIKIYNVEDRFNTIGDKRNFGMDKCTGDIILFLDDDDILLFDYIETIVNKKGFSTTLAHQKVINLLNLKTPAVLSDKLHSNTLIFSNKNVKFENKNYKEFDSFLKNQLGIGSTKFACIKNEKVGYIKRKIDTTYSVSDFFSHTQSEIEFENFMENVKFENKNIFLIPNWKHDYKFYIESTIDYNKIQYECNEIFNKKSNLDFNEIPKQIHISPESSKKIENVKKWQSVKNTWEKADSFVSSIKSRGVVSSILNILNINDSAGERVSDEIYNTRRLSCFGNPEKNIPQCDQLKESNDFGYFCGACGCGKNKLAKLDGDGYTKLHYPYLECPLKKPGFSNHEENLLSVVITALNEDSLTLNNTIKSIRDTSNNVEIIVVDDCSDNVVVVDDKEVKIIRNKERVGCAPSRHTGALAADNKYLLFTDSHMVFASGWYDALIRRTENEKENVAFCGVCLGLDSEHLTLDKHRGKYSGARLSLYEKNEDQVLEGKWITEKSGEEYDISCMMGALYFMNREYFFKIRGLSDLKMWGSDEPCLALKILQSGGRMVLVKGIQAGHIFRNTAPYATNMSYLVYNKIRMAKTMLPDELGDKLIDKLPKNGDFYEAMKMIEQEKEVIGEYKNYYKSIFSVTMEEICTNFNIENE